MFVLNHPDLKITVTNNLKPAGVPSLQLIEGTSKAHPLLNLQKSEVTTEANSLPPPRLQSFLWVINEEVEAVSFPTSFTEIDDEYDENTYWLDGNTLYIVSNNLTGISITLEYIYSYPSFTRTVSKPFTPVRILYEGNSIPFTTTETTLTYTDSINNLQGGEDVIWERNVNISEVKYSRYTAYIFDTENGLDIEYIEWGGKFYTEKEETNNYFLYNEQNGVLLLI